MRDVGARLPISRRDGGLMFDGDIIVMEDMRDFFEGNQFYTTALHRIAGQLNSHIILEEDVNIYGKKK